LLLRKFFASYGTRRLVNVTRAKQTLNPFSSAPSHSRSISIPSSHLSLSLPNGPFSFMFSYQNLAVAVGIATGYGLDDRGVGVRVPVESRIFSSSRRPDRLGVHPSYPVGTGGSFPGVKRPGREADHSPPASAEVKEMWIYTSIPPYAFMTYCLIS
jgi:hypothetical protein